MKGAQRLEFDFYLGGVVIVECRALFRFGKVQKVSAFYQAPTVDLEGHVSLKECAFDTDGIIIDWADEFLPISEWLCHYAQQVYDAERGTDGCA